MPADLDPAVREKLRRRLAFYEDIGLGEFYRDRAPSMSSRVWPQDPDATPGTEETPLPKPAPKSAPALAAAPSAKSPSLPRHASPAPSLFEASEKISGETLPIVRAD